MVSTSGLLDQTYGTYEVSAKLPPSVIQGLQETFWLYPQYLTCGNWPASGEIDFAEFYSDFPGLDVSYIQYSQSSTDLNATAFDCLINQNASNTYGVDWTPTSITVLYNGTPCLVDASSTGSEPFNQPFFIALTQALGVHPPSRHAAGGRCGALACRPDEPEDAPPDARFAPDDLIRPAGASSR